MLRIVINKCYGRFGLSPKAIKWLMDRQSELVTELSFAQYAGDDEDYIFQKLVYNAKPFDEQYTTDQWGDVLVDASRRVVYAVDAYGCNETDKMKFRMHPDLIAVVEELGAEANGIVAKLKIVEIHNTEHSAETLYISEYDGHEVVAERHNTWG